MIHRNGDHCHPSRYQVSSNSHEAQGRGCVNLIHENDVKVRACVHSYQAICEEGGSDNRRPDANMRLLYVQLNHVSDGNVSI